MSIEVSRPGRVLVLYFSASGHTKAMAHLVALGASAVPDTEVRCLSIAEATADDLIWCDGVAAGSPTNMGSIAWEMKRWLDVTALPTWPKIDGKLGCAFSTSGGHAGGGELTCMTILTILMNYGMLVFGVTDYVASGHTLHYGAVSTGNPDSEPEQEACRRLGTRLAEWVQVLVCNRAGHGPKHAELRKTS